MKSLPTWMKPPTVQTTEQEDELVGRWIDDRIEYHLGSNLPSDIYFESYADWYGIDHGRSLRWLNKVLRRLGFYVGKVVRVRGRARRCWVNVRLKE